MSRAFLRSIIKPSVASFRKTTRAGCLPTHVLNRDGISAAPAQDHRELTQPQRNNHRELTPRWSEVSLGSCAKVTVDSLLRLPHGLGVKTG